jgi:hypothetical protein
LSDKLETRDCRPVFLHMAVVGQSEERGLARKRMPIGESAERICQKKPDEKSNGPRRKGAVQGSRDADP